MSNYNRWQDDEYDFKAFKKRVDNKRFCKKNRIGKDKYGPHTYVADSNRCKKCKHKRGE